MNQSFDLGVILVAALFGLVVVPPACALVVARASLVMSLKNTAICLVPLFGFAFAHLAGVSFVYSQDGVLVFVITYAAYCLGTFTLAWTRRGLRSVVGWLLALPIAAGVLLGTIGIIGLGLILTEFEPRRSGTLGDDYRWVVTYYGNATTSYGGSALEIHRRVSLLPFLERRIFRQRYDTQEIDLDAVSVRVDPNGNGDALIEARGVLLARVPLN